MARLLAGNRAVHRQITLSLEQLVISREILDAARQPTRLVLVGRTGGTGPTPDSQPVATGRAERSAFRLIDGSGASIGTLIRRTKRSA